MKPSAIATLEPVQNLRSDEAYKKMYDGKFSCSFNLQERALRVKVEIITQPLSDIYGNSSKPFNYR